MKGDSFKKNLQQSSLPAVLSNFFFGGGGGGGGGRGIRSVNQDGYNRATEF